MTYLNHVVAAEVFRNDTLKKLITRVKAIFYNVYDVVQVTKVIGGEQEYVYGLYPVDLLPVATNGEESCVSTPTNNKREENDGALLVEETKGLSS